jgi:hypothetical protein
MKKPVLSTIRLNIFMIREPIKEVLLNNKKIGLFVSGGLDSGLLIYLVHVLRDELKTDNQFTVYTVSRPNNSLFHTHRILDWVYEKFGIRYNINQVGTDQVHHTLHVITGLKQAAKDDIDIFMLGDTKNPVEVENGPNRQVMKGAKRLSQPWGELTKDHIVQETIDSGLVDLMLISHSCERPDDGACGECWHCDERAWAFNKCGYIDPQTPPRERYEFDINYTF